MWSQQVRLNASTAAMLARMVLVVRELGASRSGKLPGHGPTGGGGATLPLVEVDVVDICMDELHGG
jgi:hypothetical protein